MLVHFSGEVHFMQKSWNQDKSKSRQSAARYCTDTERSHYAVGLVTVTTMGGEREDIPAQSKSPHSSLRNAGEVFLPVFLFFYLYKSPFSPKWKHWMVAALLSEPTFLWITLQNASASKYTILFCTRTLKLLFISGMTLISRLIYTDV